MSVVDLTPDELRRWPLPRITGKVDKESRGRVLVAGGAAQVAGAVLLAGMAALRTGAGKLQIAAPASFATQLAVATPEALVFGLQETADGELSPEAAGRLEQAVSRCDAVVIGPGLLDAASAGELALRLLSPDGPPMVIDAAAMPALVETPHRAEIGRGRLVLTPHAGEMAGLTGRAKADIEADPLAAARELATGLQAVVVLKGPETFIVSPGGHAWRNVGACPGLATSGSGDVLAGVIGGLLARGAPPAQAAAWGSFVHGACGRRLAERIAPVGFLARELLDEIPRALSELEG
jgi:ADP-dependent NAD(P)H-hydrate dehydratase